MAGKRSNKSEISSCIKFLLFTFNVIFWMVGTAVLAVGIWAWVEKGTFGKITELTDNILLDPALIFIIVGSIMFILGFLGCVGALRENTVLLLMYIVVLSLILVAFIGAAVYVFIEKDKATNLAKGVLTKTVVNYRDDPDLQDIIDWAQEDWLKCCGVNGYDDWDMNIYFNCSSPSVERCGVPHSCCRAVEDEELKNTMCGFGVRDPSIVTNAANKIYDQGCFESLTIWFNQNLIPIAGAAVGLALLMILGICFAQNLRSDIHAQKAKWEYE